MVLQIKYNPPYNTGNDFVYHDDFRDNLANYQRLTGQADEAGKVYTTNSETSGRYHTDWLNMIYPRLRLARNLLREDGVIFISIDDSEQGNLKKVCDEIFGEENFVDTIIWEKRYSPQNAVQWFSENHDFVLVYAKNKLEWHPQLLERTEEMNARYRNLDNDPRGPWKPENSTAQGGHGTKSQFYTLTAPNGKKHNPPSGRCWLYTEPVMKKMIEDNRVWFGEDGNNMPAIKRFLSEVKQGIACQTIWKYEEVGHSQEGKKELKALFPEGVPFDTPKPTRMISRMVQIAGDANEDFLVLDFFSGSATTAESVMAQNAKDGGKRKFILVQIPEPCQHNTDALATDFHNLCDVGEERIRRAGEQYKDKGVDVGFRVFRLDTSNLKRWQPPTDGDDLEQTLMDAVSNILPGRTEEDLLYEIVLKMGFDLAWPIETRTVADTQVFVVADGALFICLADRITPAVAEGMAQLHRELAPEVWKVVCRDTGFRDDAAKVNVREILKAEGLDDAAFVTV